MEVTRENIDQMNALVSIRIDEADYATQVDKAIRNLKQKVMVPGFRPGMVPAGMIKKLYGRQVLSEEVGKITVDALYKYLDEQKIEYLGNPLPNQEKNQIDWENQKEFVFYYDLGLAPQFDINIPKNDAFTHLQVEVEDSVLQDEIERLRSRYGRSINPEEVTEKDLVIGQVEELNEAGEVLEGGLQKQTYFIVDKIDDAETRSRFVGAKVNDEIEFNPKKAFKDELTASIYLSVKPEEMAGLSDRFRLKVTGINRMMPADMNQEFFDKILGEGSVASEEEFRARVSEVLKADLQGESNAKLFNDIRKKILEGTTFNLPDDFLKRWLKVKNADQKDFDPDQIEAEYDKGKDVIRWELIRKKIVTDNQIQLNDNEIMAEAKRTVVNRLNQMGYSLPEERIEEAARRILESEQEYEKIVNFLYEIKALEHLKGQVLIQEEPVSYSAFLKQLQDKPEEELV